MTVSIIETTTQQSYQALFQETLVKIKNLPPHELSYYLALLAAAIHNETSPEKHIRLLVSLNDLSTALDDFYKNARTPEQMTTKLEGLAVCLNTLIMHAKTETLPRKMQKIILNICAAVTAFVSGIIGGILGLTIGIFSQLNFFKGAYLGLVAGLVIGSTIGFRIPGQLFFEKFPAKLEFILTGIKKTSAELENSIDKIFISPLSMGTDNPYAEPSYNFYQNETKKYIIDTFFKESIDKEASFSVFLQSPQSFRVCSKQASYLGGNFKGSAGHHLFIKFKINGLYDIPIEFGERKRTPKWADQAETERQVSGQKLFAMLALDRQLQETHVMDLKFECESFQAGDNDCLTYVDKILIGTQQSPTKMKRFVASIDTWAGDKIIGNLFRLFRKTAETELDAVTPSYTDGNDPQVQVFTRK